MGKFWPQEGEGNGLPWSDSGGSYSGYEVKKPPVVIVSNIIEEIPDCEIYIKVDKIKME